MERIFVFSKYAAIITLLLLGCYSFIFYDNGVFCELESLVPSVVWILFFSFSYKYSYKLKKLSIAGIIVSVFCIIFFVSGLIFYLFPFYTANLWLFSLLGMLVVSIWLSKYINSKSIKLVLIMSCVIEFLCGVCICYASYVMIDSYKITIPLCVLQRSMLSMFYYMFYRIKEAKSTSCVKSVYINKS